MIPKSAESLSSFFILKTKGHNVSYSGYVSMRQANSPSKLCAEATSSTSVAHRVKSVKRDLRYLI